MAAFGDQPELDLGFSPVAAQKQTPMLQLSPPSIKNRAEILMLVSSKAWLCPCFPLNSISIL